MAEFMEILGALLMGFVIGVWVGMRWLNARLAAVERILGEAERREVYWKQMLEWKAKEQKKRAWSGGIALPMSGPN